MSKKQSINNDKLMYEVLISHLKEKNILDKNLIVKLTNSNEYEFENLTDKDFDKIQLIDTTLRFILNYFKK